jgi:drug/metabolite transporter (DMT)-like permease
MELHAPMSNQAPASPSLLLTHTTASRLPAFSSLALAMGIVGTSVTANKFIVGNAPIFLASAIRFILAAAILFAIVRLVEGGIPRLAARLHIILAVQSLSGVVMFNILLLIGLDMTTATVSGIITAATPAVIALMSVVVGERLSRTAWVGVSIAIAGVVAVNLLVTPAEDEASRPILGGFLVFLAVVGEGLYAILGKYAAGKVTPLATSALVSTYGALMFIPLALWDLRGFDPGSVPLSAWIAVLYLAAVVTVIAFVLWFKGLATIPASTAGAFTGMIPVTAVISAGLILGETVGPLHIAGIISVLMGIFLVASARSHGHAAMPSTPE